MVTYTPEEIMAYIWNLVKKNESLEEQNAELIRLIRVLEARDE
jgi:hypothetical protein